MKILYIANIRLPTEKAHGVQIMKMCEAFAEAGNEVVLLTPFRFNHLKENPFTYYGIKPVFSIKKIFSLDLVRLGALGFFAQAFSFALLAAQHARTHASDIVYTRDSIVLSMLGNLKSWQSLVWETHTTTESVVAIQAIRYATKIVAISTGLGNFYQQKGVPNEKIIIAPDGVDLRDFETKMTKQKIRTELSLPADRTIIEYMGKFRTMGHSKGVEEIITMMGAHAQTHPQSLLLVVGLNEDELPLAQAAAQAARLAPDEYRFVAHVRRSKVPDYLRAADVLVMNYPNTKHYAHMMSPLKVFEYMASGVPIVSSDLPTLREVLTDDSAVFVTPDDLKALKEGVERILEDPVSAQEMARNAQARVKCYVWNKRAESILNAL